MVTRLLKLSWRAAALLHGLVAVGALAVVVLAGASGTVRAVPAARDSIQPLSQSPHSAAAAAPRAEMRVFYIVISEQLAERERQGILAAAEFSAEFYGGGQPLRPVILEVAPEKADSLRSDLAQLPNTTVFVVTE
jgi:hypothetical protein